MTSLFNSELAAMTRALLGAQMLRDLETGGHTPRVQRLALRLAREASITGEDLRAVEYGSLLHDVGKMGTPDNVLRKPGSHTPAETSVMRRHVEAGAHLLRSLQFPESIVLVVEQHHERWDGLGYPKRLRRYEISAGARCFQVADALDAMLSDRCYRRGLGFERARAEVEMGAGRQFDPEAVAAFLRVGRDEWLALWEGR